MYCDVTLSMWKLCCQTSDHLFLQSMEDTDNQTITRLHCQNNVWYFFFNMGHLLTSVTRFKVIFYDLIVLILHLKSHGNIVNVK